MRRDGEKAERESFSLKSRFRYWFDNRMSGGSVGLLRLLLICSLLMILAVIRIPVMQVKYS